MTMKRLLAYCVLLIAAVLRLYGQGTFTSLTGFYDYQSNGAANHHICVNPLNGTTHVVYMVGTDSTNISLTRRSAYAFSNNDGLTWNNLNNVNIPTRRSGYPTLDLIRTGVCAGAFVIANHSESACVYVSCPANQEICPPSPSPGNPLYYPQIAATADEDVVMVASTTSGSVYATRVLTGQWQQIPVTVADGRYVVAANDSGRVAIVLNRREEGVYLVESTNNGISWSGPAEVYPPAPPGRFAGADTFQATSSVAAIYSGNDLIVAINERLMNYYAPTDSAQIVVWRQAAGYVVAASKANTPNVVARLSRLQVNHLTLGYPTIGLSGSTIAIGYMAFSPEVSAEGFNYGDIFITTSSDDGTSWAAPVNLTNTLALDERYPSVAPWSEAGQVCLVWQEDPVPGSGAYLDNAPISRTRQVFRRWLIPTSVSEASYAPARFRLEQNFPNPFNPSTLIRFSVLQKTFISMRVFDLLGREVATLVQGLREPGVHVVVWDATNMPSGIYFCRMEAGGFAQTNKLTLLR